MHTEMRLFYSAVLKEKKQIRMWYEREDHVEVEMYNLVREKIPLESITGETWYMNGKQFALKFYIPKGLCGCIKCSRKK